MKRTCIWCGIAYGFILVAFTTYLLLDTFVKNAYGGSGKTFNLGLIPALSKPFFLAGGLNGDNVAAAIAAGHPWCVDISSGAETDGYKDPEKIRRLTEIVRIQG